MQEEQIESTQSAKPNAKAKAKAAGKAKAQPKTKSKAKGRPKGKAKAAPRGPTEESSLDDEHIKMSISKQLDDVATFDFMQVKEYVMGSVLKEVNYKNVQFSIYWSRPAVGVKWLRNPCTPQVAYFGFKPKAEVGYNRRMMGNILAAMHFATWIWLQILVVGSCV